MRTKKSPGRRAAFTLIELMVVVAIIGILIGGVFKLLNAAGQNNQKAETIARMQRLQNALSGFYAVYGTYPPVKWSENKDPYNPFTEVDENDKATGGEVLDPGPATRAARRQPLAFEFPNPIELDDFIEKYPPFKEKNVVSVNTNPGGSYGENLFGYGVLSFLLPRVEVVQWIDANGGDAGDKAPDETFRKVSQWTDSPFNSLDVVAQRKRELEACNKWIPNFEGIILGGKTISGISTGEPDNGYPRFSKLYSSGSGNPFVLCSMTIRDGWGRELFYYSPPPHQSYRVWSAGPNGFTFPPWIPLKSFDSDTTKKKAISKWIEDDITRFDR